MHSNTTHAERIHASSRRNRGLRSRSAWSSIAVVTGLLLCAPLASATPQEERQGSRILKELESGKLKCSATGASDFELVGEYAMGRMFGSPAQHEAMNQMMSRMMGSGPGQSGGSYGASGSMMGGYGYNATTNENDGDFDGPSAGAMIGMMAVLIAAVGLALFLLARWRPGAPQETLERRYAKGELSAEEYQERRRLLEGS